MGRRHVSGWQLRCFNLVLLVFRFVVHTPKANAQVKTVLEVDAVVVWRYPAIEQLVLSHVSSYSTSALTDNYRSCSSLWHESALWHPV